MTVHLDHTIVPSRNKVAAAQLLADILGVPWSATGLGSFAPIFINDGLTLDFIDTDEDFPVYHFCFRVDPASFEAIITRLQVAGIAYRSTVRGAVDMKVDPNYGNIYWNEPDGHQWELLTVSYAREVSKGHFYKSLQIFANELAKPSVESTEQQRRRTTNATWIFRHRHTPCQA